MNITLLKSCAEDLDVVNAARVSFAKKLETWSPSDAGLIGFLMRNRHGSPFEHTYFKFHVEAPIAVFREWHRHRAGHSYNEMSGRYVELEEKFFRPEKLRRQTGKPGAYTFEEIEDSQDTAAARTYMDDAYANAWMNYQRLLKRGIAKEQARLVLPVGIYSQMIWSCNARSLMHFLSLRNADGAMKEIRDLAQKAEEIFAEIMPVTAEAFIADGRVAP